MTDDIEKVLAEADKAIAPVRASLFRRYPTALTLVVTLGVSATLFGIERIFASTPLFNDHPWLTLFCGLTILVVTGKLYTKLR